MQLRIKFLMIGAAITFCSVDSGAHTISAGMFVNEYQQNLLDEYESKLTITDKKISEIKKSITEAQMSKMDVKLKLGEVENSRNRIYSLIDGIKKKSGTAAQTEYDALKKEFELNQQLVDQLSDML